MPIYMKFPNATGAVSAQGFEGWIELSSASFAMERPSDSRIGTSGFSATGKLQVHHMTISKPTDGASPQLTIAALQGTFDKKVEIAFVTTAPGGVTQFMKYELTNTGIASASVAGGQQGYPEESYGLSFGQIQFTFNNLDQAGNSTPVITGYNLEKSMSL